MTVAEILRHGVEALQRGDCAGALRSADAVLAQHPDLSVAHLVRGRALLESGNWHAALDAANQAVRCAPYSAETHATLAAVQYAGGLVREARTAFLHAIELDPKSSSIQVRAAALLLELGEHDEAERLYRAALADGHRAARAGLLDVHERRGDLRAAEELLATPGVLTSPSLELRLVAARVLRRLGRAKEALELLEAIQLEHLTETQRVTVLHALGDALEDCGELHRAFRAWTRANDLRPSHFDERALIARVDDLRRRFTREAFETLPRASTRDERPVFVIGAPRSGTSLVEQLLAAHPDVGGAGELDDVPKLVRGLDTSSVATLDATSAQYLAKLERLAPNAHRVTDKLPHNAFHLGEIALLFPAARVIHVRRDPLDTGLSIYSRNFHATHDYATDLHSIGAFLREYELLMQHWHEHSPLPVHTLDYEKLVAEPELHARELLAFLGLEWDPAVLRFHESRRAVKTASYAQVRRPLYSSSVGRSAHFANELAPLRMSHSSRPHG